MKYLKKFETFINEEAETAPAPATRPRPTTKPGTAPGTKPNKPSPIRRDKPGVDPAPKAKLKTASAEDLVSSFIEELHQKGDLIKNYIK